MKMIVTINKSTGAFSHPFFAPTIEEATEAMKKINPENLSDLQFHQLCEFKNNSDIFRLRLGPANPTSKLHLNNLIDIAQKQIDSLSKMQEHLLDKQLTDDEKKYFLELEYQIAAIKFDLSKYQLDKITIYESLADE